MSLVQSLVMEGKLRNQTALGKNVKNKTNDK